MYSDSIKFLDDMINELQWHQSSILDVHESVQTKIELLTFMKYKLLEQQKQELLVG